MITLIIILAIWLLLLTAGVVGMAFRINDMHESQIQQGIEVMKLRREWILKKPN